jgi:hypothetical protein
MKKMAVVLAMLLALEGAWSFCQAQDADAPAVPTTWTSDELDQMLGPIALYPDPLVGLILPAATVPQQIVIADRYVSEGNDPSQIPVQPWDPSVQGLAHYPTVLKWMDDNLAWTTQLGEAFSSQQSDVMDSIQRLRVKAQALGNLSSTPQETVDSDDGDIEIDPTDPDDIYIPDYQPELIYEQPGVYCTFGVPFPIGVWLGFDWDWREHHLIHWGHGHERPQNWWHESPAIRHRELSTHFNYWQPINHAPAPIIAGGRGDRGFEQRSTPRTFAMPRESAPHVNVTTIGRTSDQGRYEERTRPQETIRPAERTAPPEERARPPQETVRPAERSEPSESAFGGSQSASEVRESSSRGEESRSSAGFGGGEHFGGTSNRR